MRFPQLYPHFCGNQVLEHPSLRCTFRCAMAVTVVQRHVHFAVTHDRLNHSRVLLVVHEERRYRVASQHMESEPLHDLAVTVIRDAVLDPDNTRSDCSGTDVIFNQL